MRKGKIAAQVAHASLGAVLKDSYNDTLTYGDKILERHKVVRLTPELYEWLQGPFTKVVLGCDTLEELQEFQAQAKKADIINCLITDAGKTEFHGVPTVTCLAIGPAKEEDIDKITGHLKPL